MLHKLRYMYDHDRTNQSKMGALEDSLNELEDRVFFYMEKKLHVNPKKAYKDHVKYFNGHIIKSFDE